MYQKSTAPQTGAGNATIQALAATLLFALVLAAVGPTLDSQPAYGDGTPAPTLSPDLAEAEARAFCDNLVGPNSGWIRAADGAITCTDKHGKRRRDQITTFSGQR